KSENMAPKYSIVIPTYKRSKLLKQNIESLLKQTKQDDFEIVIVDDEAVWDKETETEKMVKGYFDHRIYYYRNKQNLGMVGNWNRCIELSRGKYVTILHDDDWLEPEYLNMCEKRINGDKALYFRTRWVDLRDVRVIDNRNKINHALKKLVHLITPSKYNLTAFSCFMTVLSTNGVLYKRDNLFELGGFNEMDYPGGDYIFNSRYILKYGGIYHKACLSNYRIEENESLEVAKLFPELIYEVRKELIKYTKYNKMLLHKMAELFYDYDVRGIKIQWEANIENDLLKNKIDRNKFSYRINMKLLKIYVLIYKIYYLL
ncbi:MAG TPA: hypothetical protein DC000_05545, partial [Clostridiales bacterium]|nr:hypothetical protein [Clostridiales bacterium]